ncbi:MAG TPA: prepilin-type N-terminal cleavage/methylation domain-containing protein [Sumerlaeia bacterium]|nr:prepilin-type N-terminal cleavage/methylation domain-containing protein [Sumerlaeia bacterium]
MKGNASRRETPAFTLIELLIVVAIIAILAAIAVPNFLEAQTRSKISRAKSDQRSLATAIEAYRVDYNKYPDPYDDFGLSGAVDYIQYLVGLTTPVAYITSVSLRDPFKPTVAGEIWTSPSYFRADFLGSCWYGNYETGVGRSNWGSYNFFGGFLIISWGPDREVSYLEHYVMDVHIPGWWQAQSWNRIQPRAIDSIYDPTNGTRSIGDIGRSGGMPKIPIILGG